MHYHSILQFWFRKLDPKAWWQQDEELDQLIASRFGEIHTAASRCELYHWRTDALGRLAEIIVLDQFSRNIYRNQPQAFAQDAQALVLAQEAISLKTEANLDNDQKVFLFLPFMHSESTEIHRIAVDLYSAPGLEHNLNFELKHKAIIDRFGRYPHRNQILGRPSTDAELQFLEAPGSSF